MRVRCFYGLDSLRQSRQVKGVKLYFTKNYESLFSYAMYFNPSPTLPLRREG